MRFDFSIPKGQALKKMIQNELDYLENITIKINFYELLVLKAAYFSSWNPSARLLMLGKQLKAVYGIFFGKGAEELISSIRPLLIIRVCPIA